MPMYQIMPLVITALFATLAASIGIVRLRADLAKPLFWVVLGASASVLSLCSLFHGKTGHAGTGFVTRYGWPKPFYFITNPEVGAAIEGWGFIYFIANTSVYSAVLVIMWAAWRALRR